MRKDPEKERRKIGKREKKSPGNIGTFEALAAYPRADLGLASSGGHVTVSHGKDKVVSCGPGESIILENYWLWGMRGSPNLD
jgi:hypothetical protein